MAQMTAQQAAQAAQDAATQAQAAAEKAQVLADKAALMVDGGAAEAAGAVTGIDPFVFRLAIFVLAIFVGYFVVWSVTPALHTPLMAVTNAISSVIVVGAILAVGAGAIASGSTVAMVFGFLALILASVNIFGGFLVTQRMLAMYKKKG
jgi:NAD(P) transhydrogenase subunit alpha